MGRQCLGQMYRIATNEKTPDANQSGVRVAAETPDSLAAMG